MDRGPAVAPAEIERELRTMKAGGIGGVEIQPVYPLALDDAEHGIRNLPYLSDDFQQALRFAAAKARELLERAEHGCLIANSLRGTRVLEARIVSTEPAGAPVSEPSELVS